MTITNEIATEVTRFMDTYWSTYLLGDIKTWSTFLTDDYKNIGGTEEEIWNSKKEIIDYTRSIIDQMVGVAELRNKKTEVFPLEPFILVHEFMDMYIKIENEWKFYGKFRLSSIIKQGEKGLQVVHQHGSYPDAKTEQGQTFAFDKVSTENRELKDAVKRRTVELEKKNRELEIEAAVERVRVQSMAMQQPGDLEKVNKELFHQLTKLEIAGLAGVSFYFIDPDEIVTVWDLSCPGNMNDPNNYSVKFDSKKAPVLGEFVGILKSTQEDYFVLDFPKNRLLLAIEELKEIDISIANNFKHAVESGALLHQWNPSARITDGILSVDLLMPPTEDTKTIVLKMAGAFNQAYQRFLDLQKAEEQAKEAQIELGLERVRARAMAMQHSNELSDLVDTVFKELTKLDFAISMCIINIIDEKNLSNMVWAANPDTGKPPDSYFMKFEDYPFHHAMMKGYKARAAKFIYVIEGEEKKIYDEYLFNETEFSKMPLEAQAASKALEKYVASFTFSNFGGLQTVGDKPLSDTNLDILARFGKVFDLTYTRFNDLLKAEAQAKEAQLELSLERIRAKVTAMQQSADLLDIVVSMRTEFVALGHKANYFWYMRWLPDKYEKAMTSGDGTRIGMVMSLPRHIHGDIKLVADWEKGNDPSVVYAMDAETAVDYVAKMISLGDFKQVDPNAPTLDDIRHIGGLTFIMARTTYGEIGFSLPGVVNNPPTDAVSTLIRFAAVFDLAYRRFEDLKNAELRNRQTEIELALEKVRSRSMAMHKSEELREVIQVVYDQFVHLNIPVEHAGFIMDYKEKDDMHIWLADQHAVPFQVTIPYFDCAHWNSFNKAKANGNNFFTNQLSFDEKNKFYQDLFKVIPGVPEATLAYYFNCPGLAISTVLLENVGLYIENFSGTPFTEDENIMLMRFGKVFQQTYTRFLDLQKAEAQAKEATIEAALEKVRSRTMGMQHSTELGDVAAELFAQMNLLVTNLWTCGFVLCEKNRDEDEWWLSMDTGFTRGFFLPNTGDYAHATLYEGWIKEDAFRAVQLEGVALQQHYDWLMNLPVARSIFEEMENAGLERPDWQKLHAAYFSKGYLVLITREPCNEEEIFKRFAQVFDQTYTRFLDLKKAESQARQAKIETALEKVRARALAMQQPEELIEVSEVLRHEMGLLGVEELETCSIFIHDETINRTECWYALKDIRSEEKKLVSDHFPLNLHESWVGREMEKFYRSDAKQVSIVMQGANRKEWIKYCEERSIPLLGYYGEVIPGRTYHLYKFSHGAIGAASAGDISAESWDLLQRAASVFSLAYSRFKDLTQARIDLHRLKEEKLRAETALSELQTTQKQLIQAEKMASLGELTAGIAHEIQNPLNFVNNFSEVSKELLDEMRVAIAKGDTEEAGEIMNDVIQNLEKINHHGKRADAIVKGMLQHSRSSSGQKEPTDINALADEYLRLAYHGLRAKDKTFNAAMKTDFDDTIGSINIIPQDIGRVILNLITNAFYAVNEKKKSPPIDKVGVPYEPTVSVSTKKIAGKVEVKVTDNGKGIPTKVLDKIFQPFFTTKPTGQGTGLGLSLSYDIVKVHGGELKVETQEGQGSEFLIQIPLV